jgi:hypothetical protein
MNSLTNDPTRLPTALAAQLGTLAGRNASLSAMPSDRLTAILRYLEQRGRLREHTQRTLRANELMSN